MCFDENGNNIKAGYKLNRNIPQTKENGNKSKLNIIIDGRSVHLLIINLLLIFML